MILKNLFSKKKKLKWIQWKKKSQEKKIHQIKSTSFFAKIPEYMEYFVYVTDWYSIVIHMLHCTQQRERESER